MTIGSHLNHCRLSNLSLDDHNVPVDDWNVIDNRRHPREVIHALQMNRQGAVDKPVTAQDAEPLVDDKSHMVLHTVQDKKSTTSSSSKGSTVETSVNSRSSRFIIRVMAAADVPEQCSDKP